SGELNPKFGKGEEIKGEKNPFYGQKHTERVKKILSQKARLRVGELNSFLEKSIMKKLKN
ncbi:MAG: NUMOD3 domain-containing DNA-binding protein, partial [Eubacterium sp.]